jgi:peptidoglycan L-alanyl-D-glutamate endopeptidase CwlK
MPLSNSSQNIANPDFGGHVDAGTLSPTCGLRPGVIGIKQPPQNKRAVINRLFTTDIVGKMFSVSSSLLKTTRNNIQKYLPGILDALDQFQLMDREMILVALSTIRAETAGFAPIPEGVSKYNTSPGGSPFDLNGEGKKADELGNINESDGADYKGRGFVQLTGRGNYVEQTNVLTKKMGTDIDLVKYPELADDPVIASMILASFLKQKEYLIRWDVRHGNLKQARKLVNGGSNGAVEFASAYVTGDFLVRSALILDKCLQADYNIAFPGRLGDKI